MKQILSLALALLPCLAWAQYPSNGNQKITLGEQTTADGLIYRGVAADTTLTAKSDTAAYFVLDTANLNLYTYKASATGRKWRQLGADTAAIAYVNTYGTQTVNGAKTFTTAPTFSTALSVASGGTGRTTMPAGYILHGDGTSVDTAIGLFWDRSNSRLGVGLNNPSRNLHIQGAASSIMRIEASNTNGEPSFELYGKNSSGTQRIFLFKYDNSELFRLGTAQNVPMRFETSDISRLYIKGTGEIGIGTEDPTQKLHVSGNARITAMNGINDIGADANGVLQAATSDMNLKNTIENSPFGLNEILLLNPVTFLYNDTNRKIDSDVKEVGFIAQDVFEIIPNAVSSTGTGDLQLDYRAITATLTKAIQEQQALIKALEQRIINLENK